MFVLFTVFLFLRDAMFVFLTVFLFLRGRGGGGEEEEDEERRRRGAPPRGLVGKTWSEPKYFVKVSLGSL